MIDKAYKHDSQRCVALFNLSLPPSPGNFPPSALLVVLPYLTPSYVTTMALLVVSCGLSPFCQSGIYINPLDIAPR